MAQRQITTVQELAEVGDESILICPFQIPWQIDTLRSEEDGPARRLYRFGEPEPHPLDRMRLPATVLWEPEA